MTDNGARHWKGWYNLSRWCHKTKGRRAIQLSMQPLCQWCLEQEIVEPATEAHHATPHKGDPYLFWHGPLISTCKPCHSSRGQIEDHGKAVVTTGVDGYHL